MSKFTEDDVRILDKTRGVREKLLEGITKGTELPKDVDGVKMVRELLDSMDKAVFTKAKINVADDANKSAGEHKALLEQLVIKLGGVSFGEEDPDAQAPEFNAGGFDIEESETIMGKDEIDPDPYL